MPPTVLNIRDLYPVTKHHLLLNSSPIFDHPSGVYIGRAQSPEHFGNPFSHLPTSAADIRVDTRHQAVTCYYHWLANHRGLLTRTMMTEDQWNTLEPRRTWILNHLHLLRGKDLICWCAPSECHGDVLLEVANADPFHPPSLF